MTTAGSAPKGEAKLRNESAERLLDWLDKAFAEPPIRPMSYRAFRPLVLDSIEGIKDAERRATVQRMWPLLLPLIRLADQAKARAILDREASRSTTSAPQASREEAR